MTIPTTPPSCSCKPRASLGCEAACATGAKGRHDGTTRHHAKGAYTRAKSSSCTHDSNRRINKSSFHSSIIPCFIHSFIHSLTHWLCDRRNDRCIHMSNRSTQLSNWLQYLLSYVSTYLRIYVPSTIDHLTPHTYTRSGRKEEDRNDLIARTDR